MSARRVRKKRTRLMTRRRLNAMPVGGRLIPPPEPVRETGVVTAKLAEAPAKS